MNLWHLIARQWRRRPGRLALTTLSVSIAVAAVLGTAIAQQSVRAGSRELQQAVSGAAALEIVAAGGERFDPQSVSQLAADPNIVDSYPLAASASLLRIHGRRVKTIVVGLPAAPRLPPSAVELQAGRVCQNAGEVVLAADIAARAGVGLGGQLTMLTRRGPRSVQVVGLMSAQHLSNLQLGAGAAVLLDTLQEQFALEGQVDRIRLILHSSASPGRVAAALGGRLPASLVVQTPGVAAPLAESALRSTELALQFSGALSLAMAVFIILNTLRMNFGERRREMATVRLLGATSRQVVQLQLIEGAVLGLAGSLAGIPLGLALGRGLSSVMQQIVDAPPVPFAWPWREVVFTLWGGPVVAALAAIVPAIQAWRVSPREAASAVELRSPEGFPLWISLAGGSLLAVAGSLMLLVLGGRLPPEGGIPAGVAMLLAFVALIPALLTPIVRAVARCLVPLASVEAELAASQLVERRIRTGLTVGVLVVAVNAFLGLGNAILSNVADVRQWHRRWFSADVVLIDPAADERVNAPPGAAGVGERLRQMPLAARVIEMRFMPARVQGAVATCLVRDFPLGAELPWQVEGANDVDCLARLRAGEAVLGSVLASKLRVEPGDVVRLELAGRQLTTRIAAIASDYILGGMVINLDRQAAAEQVDLGPAAMYLVHAAQAQLAETQSAEAQSAEAQSAGTQPADALLADCQRLADELNLAVRTLTSLRAQVDGLVSGIVSALWALLAVGFVVGAAAVANALAMNVLEQTGELGLLRIVGMTRRQVRKLVFCEALLLAICGMLLGTLAGLATTVIIHFCNVPLLGHAVAFRFHPWLLAGEAVGCLLVAIVAGWSPGARAAQLDLPAAIAYE